MNTALSYLYGCGYWIQSHVGKRLAKLVHTFVYSYQRCAYLTHVARKPRFALMPKLHYLAHAALQMKQQANLGQWIQNPLGASVQLQEDFIGRPSRVSRRVNIRQVHRNVMFRCLILSEMALLRADDDPRGMDAYP